MPRDEFLDYLPYCRRRLAGDPHLPAAELFRELAGLGYPGAYSTLTRALRRYRLRPPTGTCRDGTGACTSEAPEGPGAPARPGREVRFAWLRLADPPARWDCGNQAHVLTGSLVGTRTWRGVLADGEDLPLVIEALDTLLRHLGFAPERWRFDPTPALRDPATGRPAPILAEAAAHYRAAITWASCPCRCDPDGVIGDTVHRWWPTVQAGASVQSAQDGLDRLADGDSDRPPHHPGAAADEPALPALPRGPYPATVCAPRRVDPRGQVLFRGNAYQLPAHLAGALVEVQWRLGDAQLHITAPRGAVIATHPVAPRDAGRGCLLPPSQPPSAHRPQPPRQRGTAAPQQRATPDVVRPRLSPDH
ncbi:Mu transposase domain-containing protein [Kitasatospora sp. NPDC088346]|uniref:Mu transposase domain-containing protein n=1 Tax=Kitasatospora sp. NPDC088346 TaxID=3364073 RepID=UPI003800C195